MLFDDFIDRKEWFQQLDNIYNSPGAQLFVLYGKLLVGKSRLIHEWLDRSNHNAILFNSSSIESGKDQLRSFSQVIWQFEHPNEERPNGFAFSSWRDLWDHLRLLSENQRLLVIVDEFANLRDVHNNRKGKAFNHTHWDGKLEDANICIFFDFVRLLRNILSSTFRISCAIICAWQSDAT